MEIMVFGIFVFEWVSFLIKFVVVYWMFFVVELRSDINILILVVEVKDWFLFGMIRDKIIIWNVV